MTMRRLDIFTDAQLLAQYATAQRDTARAKALLGIRLANWREVYQTESDHRISLQDLEHIKKEVKARGLTTGE